MGKEDKNFKEKIKLGSDALFWINLANQSYFNLSNQLVVLATILLPLTASVVILSKDSRVLLNSQEKKFAYARMDIFRSINCIWFDSNLD